MTYRPGCYDRNRPDWRGVIRDDSYPAFVCLHTGHQSSAEARECAKQAMAQIRADNTLPAGWAKYDRKRDLP
jgi:hypothetical protein